MELAVLSWNVVAVLEEACLYGLLAWLFFLDKADGGREEMLSSNHNEADDADAAAAEAFASALAADVGVESDPGADADVETLLFLSSYDNRNDLCRSSASSSSRLSSTSSSNLA